MTRADGYTNLLNKWGTSQDNSTAYNYSSDGIVDDMTLISQYESNGLFSKIIDRPSEETLKHGLDIDYGNEELSEYIDERLEELDFEETFTTAEKWARLYGGSIIVMFIDDGRGLEEPLDTKNIKSIEELRVFERAIVEPDYSSMYHYNEEMLEYNNHYGEPLFFVVSSHYGYFKVHRSRCLVFRNGKMPEQTASETYRYWGIPEYLRIKRALRECITTHENGSKLLERCVQAIYSMQNLSQILSTDEGEEKVLKRLQIIDMARNILNTIAIDGNGESYDFKTASLSGVRDIVNTTCAMLSAVTNIPQTILFGDSPSGMNATGKADFENYYDMVEGIQKRNMKKNIRILIKHILKQAFCERVIEEIPRFKVKFKPLWSMSEKDEAEVEATKASTKKTEADIYTTYLEANIITAQEIRDRLVDSGEFNIPKELPEELTQEEPTEEPESPETPTQTNENTPISSNMDGADTKYGVGVIVVKNGRILCGIRGDGKGLCGPGGHIQDDETPEQAAIRETKEEFGITITDYQYIGSIPATNGECPGEVFVATAYKGNPMTDDEEMFSPQWWTVGQIIKYHDVFQPFKESIYLYDSVKNSL